MSNLIEYKNLSKELSAFAEDRDWEKFHSPKNLVMALVGEAGELTEIFQWLTEVESYTLKDNDELREHAAQELADVLMYLIRLGDVLNIDLDKAVQLKLQLNAKKYPTSVS